MTTSREFAARIPAIVARISAGIIDDNKWDHAHLTALRSAQYKATADNAIDVKCRCWHNNTADMTASQILDNLDVPADNAMITHLAVGHARITW